MSDDPFSQHIPIPEVADELGINVQTVRKLIKSGKLEAFMFGGRYLVSVDDLARFKETYNPAAGRKPKLRRFA